MVWLPGPLDDLDLSRRDRLVVYYVVGLLTLVATYTLVYDYGMRELEGRGHSIFRSLQTVVETFTTTGFGADSPWQSPLMNLFVITIQLSGIALGFFTLRVIIIPLFTDAEVNLDSRLSPKRDHVVLCEYRRESAVLLEELGDLGIDYVLLSSDPEEARGLSNDGYAAIDASPQDAAAYDRASLASARAVIADAGDANVDTILTVRSVRADVDVIALTDDSDQADVLRQTGADTVLSPHAVLGHRLAEKTAATFAAELGDTVELGTDIELVEVSIQRGSPLDGATLRESTLRERTGANVVGAWIDGELQLPPDPDAVLRPNTVLLVAGEHDALEDLNAVTRSAGLFDRPERVVIAGGGEVGGAARAVLDDAGIESVTVDPDPGADPDVVGDASDRDVLRTAGLADAGAMLVCVPDDSTSLLSVVQARAVNPDLEILVRVNETASVAKALRAGADYVLSVPQVSARMVARELRGEEVLEPASQIRVTRVPATPFVGGSLAEARISERTGCRVVAVERDGAVTTRIDPARQLGADDHLVIVGEDDAVQQFLATFDVSTAEADGAR